KIPSTINKAYYVLSQGLLEGYRILGVDATFAEAEKNVGNRSDVCFETSAIYEMMVDGKKISGNAQTRKKGVLLQHGSIPLSFDADMLFDLFRFSKEDIRIRQRQKFINKAISINDITGQNQSFSSLQTAFKKGFQKSLDIQLEELILSEEHWKTIEHLRTSKYMTKAWNR